MPFVRHADVESQMAAMGASGVLFAIVDRCATSVSQVNWHLYRKARSGKPEDRVEVTVHPALSVLNNPNPFFTRQELFEAGQQHGELTGETWLVIGRNPKVPDLPLELWPVRPDRMRPIPDADNFLVGYLYTSPDGEEVPLKTRDVIFIRRPNPADPYRGISPIGSTIAHIDGEKYSAEWNRAFFINGAQPGGIIEVGDKRLSEPEFDELVERWREMHQGVNNSHRVGFLENGAHWVDVKLSQKDMDFTGLSQLSGEKIRESFGYPKPMLGSVEDVNRANAEAGEYVFAKWLLVHRLDRWKGALNHDFLPLFGEIGTDLEFDYDSPVPADRAADNAERDSKVKAVQIMVTLGYDPDEVLEWLDLPAMTFKEPPKPPPPPSPPPGGGGSDPNADPTAPDAPDGGGAGQPGKPGTPGGPDAEDVARLATFIMDGGPPAEREDRVEIVRMLIAARGHRDGHGGHRHDDGDRDDGEPWRARASATDPASAPEAPDGISPTLPEKAGPNLTKVQNGWSSALEELLAKWSTMSEAWRDRVVEAVNQRVQAGNLLGLSGITISTADGAAALEEAMLTLGADAAQQVVAEAEDQGLEAGSIHPAALDRVRTASVAQLVAGLLGTILIGSAVGEAMRIWGRGVPADEVTKRVREHLESLTDAAPRLYLGAALTQAQREGRVSTMIAGPSAALYADEVLDKNICKNCRAINRKWIGNSDDPNQPWTATYPVRGYVDCLGRDRCRGQVVAVWRDGTDWKKWVEMPNQRGTKEEIEKWKLPDTPGTPWPLSSPQTDS